MTFRLNLSDVPNADGIPQGLQDVIAYGFVLVHMNAITPGNVDDWFVRATMIQTVRGPWVAEASGDRMLTYAELCLFVGARANVAPMTEAAFRRWLMDTLRTDTYQELHAQRSAFRASQDAQDLPA